MNGQLRAGAVLLLILLSSGCGSGTADEGVPVTGSVTKAGAALDGVLVVFAPLAAGNTKGARTDASGQFTLTLPPGRYKVLLSKKVNAQGNPPGPDDDDADSAAFRETLPPQYSSPADSLLSAEVPANGTELTPFVVE